jgi:hypothetical protein
MGTKINEHESEKCWKVMCEAHQKLAISDSNKCQHLNTSLHATVEATKLAYTKNFKSQSSWQTHWSSAGYHRCHSLQFYAKSDCLLSLLFIIKNESNNPLARGKFIYKWNETSPKQCCTTYSTKSLTFLVKKSGKCLNNLYIVQKDRVHRCRSKSTLCCRILKRLGI